MINFVCSRAISPPLSAHIKKLYKYTKKLYNELYHKGIRSDAVSFVCKLSIRNGIILLRDGKTYNAIIAGIKRFAMGRGENGGNHLSCDFGDHVLLLCH